MLLQNNINTIGIIGVLGILGIVSVANTPVNTKGNLLKNGEFVENLKTGWNIYCSPPNSIKIQKDSDSEYKYVKISLKQQKGIQLSSKLMPYSPDKQYKLEFWHKGAYLKTTIQFFFKSGEKIKRAKPFQISLKVTAHKEWEKVSLVLQRKISINAEKCRISFSMNKTARDAFIRLVTFKKHKY